jgi:hypothetical protein
LLCAHSAISFPTIPHGIRSIQSIIDQFERDASQNPIHQRSLRLVAQWDRGLAVSLLKKKPTPTVPILGGKQKGKYACIGLGGILQQGFEEYGQ